MHKPHKTGLRGTLPYNRLQLNVINYNGRHVQQIFERRKKVERAQNNEQLKKAK